MKTITVFEGNAWFVSEYDPAANRTFVTGPGRMGPQPLEETEQQISFYRQQGALVDDRRAGASA